MSRLRSFQTDVDHVVDAEAAAKLKERKIRLAMEQAKSGGCSLFFHKKKLVLENLKLSVNDIPLGELCGTPLGNSLHGLSLAGNRLGTVPEKLVQSLPVLKHLDLSQCDLKKLPHQWNLPKLAVLKLRHNRFTDFPEESMLEGLPELRELDLYGNKVSEIVIPANPKLLRKLETLDLGFNDLVSLPNELDQLKSLKVLQVMNNFLAKIPMRVCEMGLEKIDVSSNPVMEPPMETCERGICSMRQYWKCVKRKGPPTKKQTSLEEVFKHGENIQSKNGSLAWALMGGVQQSSSGQQNAGSSAGSQQRHFWRTTSLGPENQGNDDFWRMSTSTERSESLSLGSNTFTSNRATTPTKKPTGTELCLSSELNGSALDPPSSSNRRSGSLLYTQTPASNGLLGKLSSFTIVINNGEDPNSGVDGDSEAAKRKRRKIKLAMDQAEGYRFPFNKKKLILENLTLSASDIPLGELCETPLGNSLCKLSLAENRLGAVPAKLVQSLPVLKHLDLSQCGLNKLPHQWNLPKLAVLKLGHNRLTDFPEESMLKGLPELRELDLYGNKISEIVLPAHPKVLSKLESLDLGFNDLLYLPDELYQLKSLKVLRVMNNFLAKIPKRVCEMDLEKIDVSSNPVMEPPIETCERGIVSMRSYWQASSK